MFLKMATNFLSGETVMNRTGKKLFVATPISAFETEVEYTVFRTWLLLLLKGIKETILFDEVFCVADLVKNQTSLDDPKDSLLQDIQELNMSSDFLLIYPVETPTSALMELGYALARDINIVIIHPTSVKLPFMAASLQDVYDNVKTLKVNDFNDTSLRSIINCFPVKIQGSCF